MSGVSGYFEQLPDAANAAFLRRYRRTFGAFAPPVSSISESVYEAVHLYAARGPPGRGGRAAHGRARAAPQPRGLPARQR